MSNSDPIDMIVDALDSLCIARAKQRVSVFAENAEGAAYHAETAAKSKAVLRDILKLLVAPEGKDGV